MSAPPAGPQCSSSSHPKHRIWAGSCSKRACEQCSPSCRLFPLAAWSAIWVAFEEPDLCLINLALFFYFKNKQASKTGKNSQPPPNPKNPPQIHTLQQIARRVPCALVGCWLAEPADSLQQLWKVCALLFIKRVLPLQPSVNEVNAVISNYFSPAHKRRRPVKVPLSESPGGLVAWEGPAKKYPDSFP